MLTTRALPFLSGRRVIHRYSTDLTAQIAAEPAVRLLEGLLRVPLGAEPLPDPDAILALRSSIALLGPPAGGRSLALLQTAARWAAAPSEAPALYLSLAARDAPNLSPRAIVAAAFHQVDLPAPFAEGSRPGLLLIDDWELLGADRRAVWQSYLSAGATEWSSLRAVVALPPDAVWSGLVPLTITPPADDPTLAAWLSHLLPEQDFAPVLAALAQPPLAPLRANLADLALLALTYPLAGLPQSRAQLYEQAYALVKPLIQAQEEAGAAPSADNAPRPATPLIIGRALLRHYRLARALAGGEDLERLADSPAAERAAVATLAAGLLDDPSPVLEALWAAIEAPGSLQALAACAREAPTRAPLFSLRLVERLTGADAAPAAPALLAGLAPALPALLAAAGRADETRAAALVPALAPALAGEHQLWLRLCDDLTAPALLRWAAADILAAAPPPTTALTSLPAEAPPEALAPRVYLAAIGGPESRATLTDSPLRDSLLALFLSPRAGERRSAAARALILDPMVPEAVAALALGYAGGDEVVERAACSAAPVVRRAALAALAAAEPETALAALGRALAHPEAEARARQETLDAIAAVPHPAAAGVLTRTVLDATMPLTARLTATDLLAGRGATGIHLLRRILATAGLPVALRCAAAGHLGRLGAGAALPAIAAILAAPGEPLLRRVAATALGALARRPELRPQATAALLTGLRRAASDTAVGERIARALGNSSDPAALPALNGLMAPGLAGVLRSSWQRLAPLLERTPAFAWPGLDLPPAVHLALVDVLADGGTMADPPSRLVELAVRQAARLALAAADGLADLAAEPALRNGALTALRRTIRGETRTDVARAALMALARVSDPADELGAILDDPATGPDLRWLAIETLGAGPSALELLRRRVERSADDPFVTAMAVEALGRGLYAPALPALRRIVQAPGSDPHLRRQAVAALGCLDHPEAAVVLTALAADQSAPAELRADAATALPPILHTNERSALRQTLRTERLPAELTAALARALAHAGEVEALAPLVRSAQSDTGADAAASIEALAGLGEQSATPILVRVSQSPLAAPGVKLTAVTALLRLGGAEFEPLLREYLTAPSPPLRIQAHAALAASFPDDPRLAEPLVDPVAPLALRLQALGHLAARNPDAPVIWAVVAAADEHPQLRLAAAALLAHTTRPEATDSLAAPLAPPVSDADAERLHDGDIPLPILRRRCAQILGALARGEGPVADAARSRLATIATDPEQPAAHRHWTAEALLAC